MDFGDYKFEFMEMGLNGVLRRSMPIPIEPDWSDIADITLKHGSRLISYKISLSAEDSKSKKKEEPKT